VAVPVLDPDLALHAGNEALAREGEAARPRALGVHRRHPSRRITRRAGCRYAARRASTRCEPRKRLKSLLVTIITAWPRTYASAISEMARGESVTASSRWRSSASM